MESFFKLKEHGTKVSTEILAGFTTFFAMAYIIFVNPEMLSITGMPTKAVFLATIFASIAGTLVMGLFANVPYAQAPGMGLNAFFTFTVCGALGYTWQQGLAMVFICGILNVIITVTKFRKMLITAIPTSLQSAIGGGIGVFIGYIGIKNAGLLSFTASPGSYQDFGGTIVANSQIVPALVNFNTPIILLSLASIALMVILVVKKVPGAICISIAVTTIASFIISEFGLDVNAAYSAMRVGGAEISGVASAFSDLKITFGAAFGPEGLPSLFADSSKIPQVIMTIFAFSLSDTFDTIGTFIGTGRRTGIFDEEDRRALENSTGFKSKMDKALFADSIATSIGAVFGTSNTTTYVESAAGIGAGGRTGLTSVVVSLLFAVSILLAPFVGLVPSIATAPALIIVGVMMLAAFAEISWGELSEAVPAFFATIFMGLAYSISYGIAAGFIFYCIIKVITGKGKEIHPILWVSTLLFVLNFIVLAIL